MFEEITIGTKVNERPINNIRYADDTILITETIQKLQTLLNRVVDAGVESGLTLNFTKTKFMTIVKTQQQDILNKKGVPTEKVKKIQIYW